tara:strand:+ start:2300 stop:2512 length:213 start_codon:yes stop_codon:yes gene_type:complete
MKKNYWSVYIFDKDITTQDKEIVKIMNFNTMNSMSEVIGEKPSVLSNYFHGLIKPRGILKFCIIYQSICL